MQRATLVCLMAACGSTAESPNVGDDGGVKAADAAPTGGADATIVGEGTVLLADYGWTLAPRSEKYYCVRKTIPQQMLINRFEPVLPFGTHHTVLTVGTKQQPDGVTECGSAVANPHTIYASGVATPPMDLPPGVATRIDAGEQILLNLHLFNVGDTPLSGRSGMRVRTVAPSEVVHEAEALLAGTLSLEIMPGVSTQTGYCTMNTPSTLFAIAPHMHKLGIHQRVSVVGSDDALLDRDYSFDEQTFQIVDVPLAGGVTIRVDCTYANDTGGYVGWGESSTAEMCFAILFRYPSTGHFNLCTN